MNICSFRKLFRWFFAQLDLWYPLGPLLSVISYLVWLRLLNRPQRQKDSLVTVVQSFTVCKTLPIWDFIEYYDSLARQQDDRHNYPNPVDEETGPWGAHSLRSQLISNRIGSDMVPKLPISHLLSFKPQPKPRNRTWPFIVALLRDFLEGRPDLSSHVLGLVLVSLLLGQRFLEGGVPFIIRVSFSFPCAAESQQVAGWRSLPVQWQEASRAGRLTLFQIFNQFNSY